MVKHLDITPKIAAALKLATDDAVQPDQVMVFETISLNTLPLSKRGLFDKAVVTENTLNQMADYVNKGGAVPLHTLHQQGVELPVGKTFAGEVFHDVNGIASLRSLFYLPLSEVDLINKLETDVINEVSVGMQTTHINCSECGWDYRGDDATWMNLYDGQCANEHTVGVDGVHVILNGLDQWLEQSLVSLGAANNAKIQSRTKSLMAAANYEKLAASGIRPEITVLHATQTMKEAPEMDMTLLIGELTTAKAQIITLTTEAATAKTALEVATTALTASQSEVAELKARVTPEISAVVAERDTAKASAEAARAVLHKEATRLTVALALEAPAADATLEVLTASIDANRTKMSAAFPVNGVIQNSAAGTGTKAGNKAATSSFKGA